MPEAAAEVLEVPHGLLSRTREVFIQWGKQGSTGAGLMDIYAVALSVGLQHRVPLIELITPGLDLLRAQWPH